MVKKTNNLSTVGGRLRAIRTKHGLTQAALAEMLHTDNASISKMECDKQAISMEYVQQICIQLGESADYLLLGMTSNKSLALTLPLEIQQMILALADEIRACQNSK